MRQLPSRGFTYLGLIILVAVIGLVGAAALKVGSLLQRAAAEEELLEIGAQFSEALRSYAAATPQGQPQQPPGLADLLKDPRFPNPRRHLRKIFVDPVTGKAEWGIIYLGDKIGVLGVYSLSDRQPLKIANFDIRFQNMDNKLHISDWKFLMAGGGDKLNPPVVTPPNSMTAAPSLFAPETKPAELKAGDKSISPEVERQPPDPNAEPEPEPEAVAPPEEGKGGDSETEKGEAEAEDDKETPAPAIVSPPPPIVSPPHKR
ncbi:MAG: type II secretion system protein [Pseudomonadota bacterium]